jgi:hypothetical protein
MAEHKHLDKLQLIGVILSGVGLLYVLFHKSNAALPSDNAGASPPILIGSGGSSGASGLSPVTGSGGTPDNPQPDPANFLLPSLASLNIPGITLPANAPVTLGSVTGGATNIGGTTGPEYVGGDTGGGFIGGTNYTGGSVGGTLLSLIFGGNSTGGGCCAQSPSVPYASAPPAITAPNFPAITPPSPASGYTPVPGTASGDNIITAPGGWFAQNEGQSVLGPLLGDPF